MNPTSLSGIKEKPTTPSENAITPVGTIKKILKRPPPIDASNTSAAATAFNAPGSVSENNEEKLPEFSTEGINAAALVYFIQQKETETIIGLKNLLPIETNIFALVHFILRKETETIIGLKNLLSVNHCTHQIAVILSYYQENKFNDAIEYINQNQNEIPENYRQGMIAFCHYIFKKTIPTPTERNDLILKDALFITVYENYAIYELGNYQNSFSHLNDSVKKESSDEDFTQVLTLIVQILPNFLTPQRAAFTGKIYRWLQIKATEKPQEDQSKTLTPFLTALLERFTRESQIQKFLTTEITSTKKTANQLITKFGYTDWSEKIALRIISKGWTIPLLPLSSAAPTSTEEQRPKLTRRARAKKAKDKRAEAKKAEKEKQSQVPEKTIDPTPTLTPSTQPTEEKRAQTPEKTTDPTPTLTPSTQPTAEEKRAQTPEKTIEPTPTLTPSAQPTAEEKRAQTPEKTIEPTPTLTPSAQPTEEKRAQTPEKTIEPTLTPPDQSMVSVSAPLKIISEKHTELTNIVFYVFQKVYIHTKLKNDCNIETSLYYGEQTKINNNDIFVDGSFTDIGLQHLEQLVRDYETAIPGFYKFLNPQKSYEIGNIKSFHYFELTIRIFAKIKSEKLETDSLLIIKLKECKLFDFFQKINNIINKQVPNPINPLINTKALIPRVRKIIVYHIEKIHGISTYGQHKKTLTEASPIKSFSQNEIDFLNHIVFLYGLDYGHNDYKTIVAQVSIFLEKTKDKPEIMNQFMTALKIYGLDTFISHIKMLRESQPKTDLKPAIVAVAVKPIVATKTLSFSRNKETAPKISQSYYNSTNLQVNLLRNIYNVFRIAYCKANNIPSKKYRLHYVRTKATRVTGANQLEQLTKTLITVFLKEEFLKTFLREDLQRQSFIFCNEIAVIVTHFWQSDHAGKLQNASENFKILFPLIRNLMEKEGQFTPSPIDEGGETTTLIRVHNVIHLLYCKINNIDPKKYLLIPHHFAQKEDLIDFTEKDRFENLEDLKALEHHNKDLYKKITVLIKTLFDKDQVNNPVLNRELQKCNLLTCFKNLLNNLELDAPNVDNNANSNTSADTHTLTADSAVVTSDSSALSSAPSVATTQSPQPMSENSVAEEKSQEEKPQEEKAQEEKAQEEKAQEEKRPAEDSDEDANDSTSLYNQNNTVKHYHLTMEVLNLVFFYWKALEKNQERPIHSFHIINQEKENDLLAMLSHQNSGRFFIETWSTIINLVPCSSHPEKLKQILQTLNLNTFLDKLPAKIQALRYSKQPKVATTEENSQSKEADISITEETPHVNKAHENTPKTSSSSNDNPKKKIRFVDICKPTKFNPEKSDDTSPALVDRTEQKDFSSRVKDRTVHIPENIPKKSIIIRAYNMTRLLCCKKRGIAPKDYCLVGYLDDNENYITWNELIAVTEKDHFTDEEASNLNNSRARKINTGFNNDIVYFRMTKGLIKTILETKLFEDLDSCKELERRNLIGFFRKIESFFIKIRKLPCDADFSAVLTTFVSSADLTIPSSSSSALSSAPSVATTKSPQPMSENSVAEEKSHEEKPQEEKRLAEDSEADLSITEETPPVDKVHENTPKAFASSNGNPKPRVRFVNICKPAKFNPEKSDDTLLRRISNKFHSLYCKANQISQKFVLHTIANTDKTECLTGKDLVKFTSNDSFTEQEVARALAIISQRNLTRPTPFIYFNKIYRAIKNLKERKQINPKLISELQRLTLTPIFNLIIERIEKKSFSPVLVDRTEQKDFSSRVKDRAVHIPENIPKKSILIRASSVATTQSPQSMSENSIAEEKPQEKTPQAENPQEKIPQEEISPEEKPQAENPHSDLTQPEVESCDLAYNISDNRLNWWKFQWISPENKVTFSRLIHNGRINSNARLYKEFKSLIEEYRSDTIQKSATVEELNAWLKNIGLYEFFSNIKEHTLFAKEIPSPTLSHQEIALCQRVCALISNSIRESKQTISPLSSEQEEKLCHLFNSELINSNASLYNNLQYLIKQYNQKTKTQKLAIDERLKKSGVYDFFMSIPDYDDLDQEEIRLCEHVLHNLFLTFSWVKSSNMSISSDDKKAISPQVVISAISDAPIDEKAIAPQVMASPVIDAPANTVSAPSESANNPAPADIKTSELVPAQRLNINSNELLARTYNLILYCYHQMAKNEPPISDYLNEEGNPLEQYQPNETSLTQRESVHILLFIGLYETEKESFHSADISRTLYNNIVYLINHLLNQNKITVSLLNKLKEYNLDQIFNNITSKLHKGTPPSHTLEQEEAFLNTADTPEDFPQEGFPQPVLTPQFVYTTPPFTGFTEHTYPQPLFFQPPARPLATMTEVALPAPAMPDVGQAPLQTPAPADIKTNELVPAQRLNINSNELLARTYNLILYCYHQMAKNEPPISDYLNEEGNPLEQYQPNETLLTQRENHHILLFIGMYGTEKESFRSADISRTLYNKIVYLINHLLNQNKITVSLLNKLKQYNLDQIFNNITSKLHKGTPPSHTLEQEKAFLNTADTPEDFPQEGFPQPVLTPQFVYTPPFTGFTEHTYPQPLFFPPPARPLPTMTEVALPAPAMPDVGQAPLQTPAISAIQEAISVVMNIPGIKAQPQIMTMLAQYAARERAKETSYQHEETVQQTFRFRF